MNGKDEILCVSVVGEVFKGHHTVIGGDTVGRDGIDYRDTSFVDRMEMRGWC